MNHLRLSLRGANVVWMAVELEFQGTVSGHVIGVYADPASNDVCLAMHFDGSSYMLRYISMSYA